MSFPRRLAALFGLALALALGQQAALLHGLAHATERIAQKQDGKPASVPCDQCALAAQLDGVAGGADAAPHARAALVPAQPVVSRPAVPRVAVVFHSRAPPVLS